MNQIKLPPTFRSWLDLYRYCQDNSEIAQIINNPEKLHFKLVVESPDFTAEEPVKPLKRFEISVIDLKMMVFEEIIQIIPSHNDAIDALQQLSIHLPENDYLKLKARNILLHFFNLQT